MAARVNTVRIVCTQCGDTAVRQASGGKPARYCGNACKIKAHRAHSPDRAKRYRASEASRQRIANHYRIRVVVRMNVLPTTPKEPAIRCCQDCAKPVPKGKHLCDTCRLAHTKIAKAKARKLSPSRRADKARRKAMNRGRLAGAERFDPLEVLARDGWRCHICGVKTPKRLRGTFGDMAPELDHIMPLAVGGAHTRQNTACACRRCNIAKAGKPLGQLRLVA